MKDKYTMHDTSRICAVVVSYNRKMLLEECITGLTSQTRPLDEIIVIDNASSDGTDKLVKTKFMNITYIKLAENIGGAGGFHEGIKLAYEKGHDWIWVMDDDAFPLSDALAKLTNSPAMSQDNVYALASAVLNRDGSTYLETRRSFDARTLLEKVISSDKYQQAYFLMDTGSFVGLLIGRKAVRDVGLPLRDFFIYYDDTEYSLRIRNLGIMVTIPESKIIHGERKKASDESPRMNKKWDWKTYYFIRNRIYTYRKHGNIGFRFYTNLVIGTLITTKEIMLFHHSRFKSMKILFWSTLDGLRGKLGKNTAFLPD